MRNSSGIALGLVVVVQLAGTVQAQPGTEARPGVIAAPGDTEQTVFVLSDRPRAPSVDDGAPEHRRFFGGLTLGRGSIEISCAICDNVAPIREALSYSGHVGWMILPRVAVVAEHWNVSYNDRGTEWFDDSADHLIAQRMTTIGAQVWVASRLWLRAGVGVGRHISDSRYAKPWLYDDEAALRAAAGTIVEHDEASRFTPAVTGAIGYEWARNSRFAVDVQLRAGATHRPDDEYQVFNTALVFGASWF